MKKKIIASVFIISLLINSLTAFSAGYTVLMKPQIDYIDEKTETDEYNELIDYMYLFDTDTYFYPTPFYKGFSVVHTNVLVTKTYEPSYYSKESFVVDINGKIKELGSYDGYGLKPTWLDENPSELYKVLKDYKLPSFNPSVGVNSEGQIIVSKNRKGGVIDVTGKVLIPCAYSILTSDVYEKHKVDTPPSYYDEDIYNGRYFARNFYPYSYFDYYTEYYNELAVVSEGTSDDSKFGIVDKLDNIIVPFEYDCITPCYDGVSWVLKDGKWGIIAIDSNTITVKVNDEEIQFDQIPLVINGRTLAPLRAIFEKLGAEVKWNERKGEIISTKGDKVITLTVGKNEMYINDRRIRLDVAPQIIGERTLVPVRIIAEAFDCEVEWDEENYIVKINDR